MKIKDNLVDIVCSSAIGAMFAFSAYSGQDGRVDHYINKQMIGARIEQFERGEPQSKTMWDYLQGKGDTALAGLIGVGGAVLFYKLGKRQDKKREERLKREMKARSPDLYQIVQKELRDNPEDEK